MKLLLTLFFLITSLVAQANEIKLIIPYSPGGSGDRIARTIERELSTGPYKIIVEYRLGAGGSVAANLVAATQKETVLMVASTGLITATGINYNVETDFKLVNYIGHEPLLLVVKNNNSIKSFKDFLKISKTNTMPYGTGGFGTSGHIAAAIVAQNNDNFIHIPYKGGSAAIVGLLGNDVSWLFESVAVTEEYIANGRLTPLAVYSDRRLLKYPNIPTLQELGYNNRGVYRWWVVIANRDADSQITSYINARLNHPSFKQKMQDLNININKPAYIDQFFQHEAAQARQLFQSLKLQ